MSEETRRIIRLSVLGSVSILPLLILPAMIGALIDHAAFAESAAGWVAAAGAAGSAVGAIVIGLRIRHLDPRKLAFGGLLLLAVADAASAMVGFLPAWLFLAIRVLSGLGGAAAYASVMASFATLPHPERGYGTFMVFQFTISALGLYLLPQALPTIGIVGMYLGLAMIAVVTLTQTGAAETRAATSEAGTVELKAILAPAAILLLLAIGCFETANNMHFTYAERIGIGYGLSLVAIGEILAVATLVGIPAGLSVVWIGDRFGQLRPITFALLVSVVSLYALLNASETSTYFVVMCALSFAWAFALPFFFGFAARLDRGGSVVVAAGFFTSGGAALGPALAALLVEPGDYGDVLLFAIGLYGIVTLLATLSRNLALRQPA